MSRWQFCRNAKKLWENIPQIPTMQSANCFATTPISPNLVQNISLLLNIVLCFEKFSGIMMLMEELNQQQKELTMNKKEFWRAVKFVLFSISAGVIQIVSFTLLQEVVIKDVTQPYGWSYFISLTLSVVWNFTFNRKFTFKSANNVPIAMLKVLGYYVVFTPVSIFGGIALVNLGWNPYLVLAISMVVNFVTEYIFDSLVVFRNSIDTNDIAQKQAQKNAQTDVTTETPTADQPTQE